MGNLRPLTGVRLLLLPLLAGTVLLTLTGDATALRGQAAGAHLLTCAHSELLFPSGPAYVGDTRFRITRWKDKFDSVLNAVINAHLAPADDRLLCAGGATVAASPELTALARTLPPWSNGAPFTETDFSSVVLAYLNAYQCAMNARASLLFTNVKDDVVLTQPGTDVSLYSIGTQMTLESVLIKVELATAPRTVHRVLRYLSGLDRLRPVEANLKCLERASLDIRNIMSLNADVAACSEARKGQSSLKDLAPATP